MAGTDKRELDLLRILDKGVSEKDELNILRELDSISPQPDVPQEPSLLGRVGERVSGLTGQAVQSLLPEGIGGPLFESGMAARERVAGRGQEVQQTLSDLQRGAVDPVQAGIQAIGKGGAGSFLDVAGESVAFPFKAGFRALPEPAQESLRAGGSALLQTQPVQAGLGLIRQGAERFGQFKEERPQAAKTVESLGNILAVGAPVAKSTLRGKAVKIERKASKQVRQRREDFVDDLIRPEATKKVLTEQAARTTEKGVLKTKVVALSKREGDIAKEANKIKTISPRRTLQHNRNEISKNISRLNKELEVDVRKSGAVLAKDQTKKAIDNNIKKLIDENPFIKSETATRNMAVNVQRNAERILAKHPNTPLGVLRARKELDSWALGLNKRAFDSSTATAFKDSLLAIRKTMNKIVDENVPSATVKKKLKSQNLLLDAMDNIDPKIAAEKGRNAITRLFNKVTKIGPARTKTIAALGTVTGVGIIGGSQIFSGPVAAALGTTAILYAGHRAIISPTTKKALAKLLKGADKVLLTTKNPSTLRQLRADRAVIADLLKNSTEENNGN